MPWSIQDDNPDCAGWAVVKDDTGEIEGCHRSRDAALRQLADLFRGKRLPQLCEVQVIQLLFSVHRLLLLLRPRPSACDG